MSHPAKPAYLPGGSALQQRQAEWARQAVDAIDYARAYVRWKTEGGHPAEEGQLLWDLVEKLAALPEFPR